jgi:hypothetical protein
MWLRWLWKGCRPLVRNRWKRHEKETPPVGVWGMTEEQIEALQKDRNSQQSDRTFFQGLIR